MLYFGSFSQIWAKMDFLQKSGCVNSNVTSWKNQKKSIKGSKGKYWTDRPKQWKKSRQNLFHRTLCLWRLIYKWSLSVFSGHILSSGYIADPFKYFGHFQSCKTKSSWFATHLYGVRLSGIVLSDQLRASWVIILNPDRLRAPQAITQELKFC